MSPLRGRHAPAWEAATLGGVSYLQIFLLAVGLAMDAMAVAAVRGAATLPLDTRGLLLPALLFGGAQALMPALGWVIGAQVGGWVAAFDHWFAFVVLGTLGAKMLHEARSEDPHAVRAPGGLRTLLALALATSIDAFAVGITLPMLDAPFFESIATIGIVTFVLSIAGVLLGRHFGRMLGRRLDAFGGIVLIVLGCKILVEHLSQ